MNPLVSVILPTYNREIYIERAVKSIINQTYANWELLIVDDGSTDNTLKIIEPYLNTEKRIQLISLKPNKGVCFARNTGISHSKGEYITFLDSDDEYFPKKLELQVKCFLESPIENLGVVSCGRIDIMNGKKIFEWIPKFRGDIINNLLKKDRVGAQTPFMMIKKKILIDNEILFDADFPSAEEWDLLIRVCMHAKFDFVPTPLVKVHQHKGERVYTNDRGLIAWEKQYKKYEYLLVEDKKIHDRFILKMADIRYTYGHSGNALKLLDEKIIDKNIKIFFWKLYIRTFPKFGNIPSRAIYKIMKYLSYN